jgi:hypothetical protein
MPTARRPLSGTAVPKPKPAANSLVSNTRGARPKPAGVAKENLPAQQEKQAFTTIVCSDKKLNKIPKSQKFITVVDRAPPLDRKRAVCALMEVDATAPHPRSRNA